MKFRTILNVSKRWQHPWGLHRMIYCGTDKSHAAKGWALGLGIIGFEFWP